jgi:hypothetical protein
MILRYRGLPILSTIAIAIPITVYGQAVTTYDGTYTGVSMTASGGNNACVAPPSRVPPTLTIRGGAVQWGKITSIKAR